MKKKSVLGRTGKLPPKIIRGLEKHITVPLSELDKADLTAFLSKINEKIDFILSHQFDDYGVYLDDKNGKYFHEVKERIAQNEKAKSDKKRGLKGSYVDYGHGGYIKRPTFVRYCRNEETTFRVVCALAAFLGFTPDEIDSLYEDDVNSRALSYMYYLAGAWDVYVFNSRKKQITRTPMWLEVDEQNEERFRVHFKSPWEAIYEGDGYVNKKDVLVIHIYEKDGDQEIYLTSKLPKKEDASASDKFILNAAGITTGSESPITGSLIFVKNLKAVNKRAFMNSSVYEVSFMHKEALDSESYLINEIVIYLTRHRDRKIDPFVPDKVNEISERNREYLILKHRDYFRRLKRKFERDFTNSSWYSFSRIIPDSSKICVFEWRFKFNAARQEVTVNRHRVNGAREFKGAVTMLSSHLYFDLLNKSGDRRKMFVAYAGEDDTSVQIKGISTTLYYDNIEKESSHMAVREILVYMPRINIEKYVTLKDGFMLYQDFVKLDELDLAHKLYLSNRELSTLTYPLINNNSRFYARQFNAVNYAGNYFAFVPNIYTEEDKESLYALTIKIDELTNVICKVKYHKSSRPIQLKGVLEMYMNNLHIRLDADLTGMNRPQIADIMIDPVRTGYMNYSDVFSGMTLDTDRDRKVGAYPLIIVRSSSIPMTEFKPFIINDVEGDKVVQKLENILLLNNLGTIQSYFFDTHPQGRFLDNK